MKTIQSIRHLIFEAMDSDRIPMILNGLHVTSSTMDGEFEQELFFEKYSDLRRFSKEELGDIKVLRDEYIWTIDYTNSDSGDGRQIARTLIHALGLVQIRPVIARYDVDDCYGGDEEGGWYYRNYVAPHKIDKMPIHVVRHNDMDRYKYEVEFFLGQNVKNGREFYS